MSFTQKLFNRIHSSQLIYNICWEDPDIDRSLMQLDPNARVLMITSAGCNALCYLLDEPKHISCIDMNHRQNAVLALKIALIKHTDFDTLFDFFGKGYHPNAKEIYFSRLRNSLEDERYKSFWDKHIKNIQLGKYHYSGTSGRMAKWVVRRMKKKKVYKEVLQLFSETDKEIKIALFDSIFFKTFPKKFARLINSNFSMSMLGVPDAQKKLIETDEGSVYNFIYKKLAYVFTNLPLENNYFWKFYLKGGLSKNDIAPAYLQEKNFDKLKAHIHKISLHTTSVESYLTSADTTFTHYVLLDHQDWMAYHKPELLQAEWNAIIRKSERETSFLLRSASLKRDFIPSHIKDKIKFNDELTSKYHFQDRVGTYASTHFGTLVNEPILS